MATAAYIDKHRTDRHLSMGKLSVILASVALWATLIAGLALVAN